LTTQIVIFLIAPNHSNTMAMTYMTEEERKTNVVIALTKIVEEKYESEVFLVVREAYQKMYEALNDAPKEWRMEIIEGYKMEIELNKDNHIAYIIWKFFNFIFTKTYMNLKCDLLEAMKSIC